MDSADTLMEEKKLLAETKYRNYMSNIDKALRNFEYSSEWADLISALGKLCKAISGNTQYQVIPRRIKISKRLAQCMHPALPSGVHLKALETYAVIFAKTGKERLATELFIYSAGLFPLLSYAAMTVRPALLGIYEKHFVPLGDKLRPALSGFLSGVLPGYESGLDHFERTSTLLKQVCIAVNPSHFYTVLWECVATNASIRLPAITYLLDNFNKRLDMQEQVYIIGHNREIMMTGLCACLNDSVILVQRNTLEFLLLGFPMHSVLLTKQDLIKLVTNGLNTILRRDMSLNRRLYAWLLGCEVAKNSPTYDTTSLDGAQEDVESYFEKHSQQILIQSLINTLKLSLESMDLKPYRIMMSLLDKNDIGSAVLDHVLCDIIRSMSLSNGNVEVIKSANMLFGSFDPIYIWSFMTSMYEKSCKSAGTNSIDSTAPQVSCTVLQTSDVDIKYQSVVGSGDPCLIEICLLTEFLLETISLEMYNETTRVYLPKVFLAITQMLTIHQDNISSEEVIASLKLCMKIVSRVQPMITSPIKLTPRVNQCYSSSDEKSIKGASKTNTLADLMGNTLTALEKSKSDSKLNQFADSVIHNNIKDEEPMRRTNSNQSMERKSPKKKKAKSYSKLSELDKEVICISDTGQQSSSDLDTPLSIKKIKSKVKAQVIRTSPKKSRPKEIPIHDPKTSSPSPVTVQKSNIDETDDQPQSAPPTEQMQKQNGESLIFNYQETENECTVNDIKNSSILEKCIRQYEVFFEIYLARKVLQIEPVVSEDKCTVKVQLDRANSVLQVKNIFQNENVFEDENPERWRGIDNIFKILRVDVISRSKLLQSLLRRSMFSKMFNTNANSATDLSSDSDDTEQQQQFTVDAKTKKSVQQLMELTLNSSLRGAIKLAATLLVEMSTFPNCNKNIVLDKSEQEIPRWLKVLCIVICFAQTDKELQLTVVTALFDLISLLKSQIEHATSPGVTFVIMLPLLKFGHVSYIEHKTRIFQLVVSILWDHLGEPCVDPAQVTTLLYQLHSCLESGLVESVIGNRMFSQHMHQHLPTTLDTQRASFNEALVKSRPKEQPTALQSFKYERASDMHLICATSLYPTQRLPVERLRESESQSYKKFELLWHLGRNKQSSKGFEKTLLKVLDTLGLPYYMSQRTFVTKWLQSALLRGDLSRLVKPLYKILLSSNSKRVGIVHLQLLTMREGEDGIVLNVGDSSEQVEKLNCSFDRDVYAISSEYGNVKYHMEATTANKKRSPIRSFPKKIFGVTLSSKNNKTSNFVSDKTPAAVEANSTTIGLIVNPLDNSPDFDDDTDFEEPKLECKSNAGTKDPPTSLEDKLSNAMLEIEVEPIENLGEQTKVHYTQDYTDDSASSGEFESDSEQRETSVEKDDSLTISSSTGAGSCTIRNSAGASNDLTRFAGDCECVTELLTKHERTKNRKTYQLTREKTPGESSLASATTTDDQTSLDACSQSLNTSAATCDNDDAHAADEYFNAGKNAELQDAASGAKGSPKKSVKKRHALKEKRKHKKMLSSSEMKRLSCISKISTDSNTSIAEVVAEANTGAQQQRQSDNEDEAALNAHDDQESESQTISINQSTVSETINVEDKRRNLSLETSKLTRPDWETIEKSKQNLEILRQNAAQNNQDEMSSLRSSTKSCTSLNRPRQSPDSAVHFFHNHLLIYLGVYDTRQTLYAFQTLRNIIACDTRTFLCLSITSAFSSGSLKQLLIRHRKSISGKGFNGSISNSEYAQSYRGCMQLELLVTLCLFYARGYFYCESMDVKNESPTLDDIVSNCRVQLESIELLALICTELIDIVKGMGKGLACYIADLMARCKLQKVILHCLNSSVQTFGRKFRVSSNLSGSNSFAAQVLSFNDPQDDCLHAESFQIQVLRLLMAVIKLEHEVQLLKSNSYATAAGGAAGKEDQAAAGNISPTRLSSLNVDAAAVNVKYLPNCQISQQPMFLAAVLSALQNERLRHLHRQWTDLITSSLNCFSFGSLTNIVISVVHQLCNNIDRITKLPLKSQYDLPPDYVLAQLEAITILCHYCLLDNTQQTSLSHLFNQAYPQTSVAAAQSSNTGQLLNSIVHSFLSSAAANSGSGAQNDATAARQPQLQAARSAVLSHLPRIVASVAGVWDSELGQVRQIKQQLMEFLSPVSLHHGSNFLTSVAVTWQERGEVQRRRVAASEANGAGFGLNAAEQYQRNSTLQACAEQLSLVTLVSSIRVMPMDSFVQTLHQVVKSPPPIHRPPAHLSVEVSALELFYFYLKSAPAPQLGDAWSSLLLLLRDGMSLSPPAQFTLLMLLNEFVQRCPQLPFQDKKDIRDLHDVTSRLVDSLSNVAGACLEQTTWLRRNLAVKEDIPQAVVAGSDGGSRDGSQIIGSGGIQQYSLQAQSMLAAVLANLLDVAYGSQEKDKVVTIITTLLYNITPYLRNHTARNVPSFFACSALLASISGFQYTRKAWRKDMLDLMLDNSFFQMDISCLPYWRQIMDSLMTYDNTTFRELMSRVSLTQTGSLNIFASREQEYEQRAMLLKRLAFVIYCSEFDQYNKYMPEIQEQLTNSLRLLPSVHSVQAAVFLCFRVLLLRMSPDHVTSLWPIIIAEMVHVFLAMEQELKSDCDDLSPQMRLLPGLDVSWSSTSSGNGLNSHTQIQHWRSVQLEASKLLELGCVLPATNLPHFQMYRWAFVGTEFDVHEDVIISNGGLDEDTVTIVSSTVYVPHVRRIARLMDMKYAKPATSIDDVQRDQHLMLSFQQIQSLHELYDFFSKLSISCPNPYKHADTDKDVIHCLKEIENVLGKDFLERMPNSTTPR